MKEERNEEIMNRPLDEVAFENMETVKVAPEERTEQVVETSHYRQVGDRFFKEFLIRSRGDSEVWMSAEGSYLLLKVKGEDMVTVYSKAIGEVEETIEMLLGDEYTLD